MKLKSKTAPIHLPADSDELKKEIDWLDARYKVTRPNIYQIKVATFNYFWSTGRITIDPCQTYKDRGFDAFVRLIGEHVTKRETFLGFDF